jgi:2-dehydropantoate 2-reductase
MRICVYGAGAIGGHLAARFAKGGADVSVVVRGANLVGIRARGLTIQPPNETYTAQVTATDDPRTLGPQDVVVITAKAPALASVAAGIGPLLGPDTPVVFVLNGIPWWYFHAHGGALDGQMLPKLDPDNVLREAVGMERVIGGVVHSACMVLEPGLIEVSHSRNRLVLGEPDGTMSARVEAIAAPLRAGGMEAEVTPRIRDAIWSKLALNLASGPIAVLTQSTPLRSMPEPACEAAVRRIYAETEAVAAALGWKASVDADAQIARSRDSLHKASILQDLELGRPMEVGSIYETPLDLARRAGVETPTLDLLVALVKVRAGVAGLYGG